MRSGRLEFDVDPVSQRRELLWPAEKIAHFDVWFEAARELVFSFEVTFTKLSEAIADQPRSIADIVA